jgi:hypothetical protein
MTGQHGKILGFGGYYNTTNMIEHLVEREKKFSMGVTARTLAEAMNEVENGGYWGVYVGDLALSLGRGGEQYDAARKKFEAFDSPGLCKSTGLAAVEAACNKGLITVVGNLSGYEDEIGTIEGLGATAVTGSEKLIMGVIGAFRGRL